MKRDMYNSQSPLSANASQLGNSYGGSDGYNDRSASKLWMISAVSCNFFAIYQLLQAEWGLVN